MRDLYCPASINSFTDLNKEKRENSTVGLFHMSNVTNIVIECSRSEYKLKTCING